MEYRPLGKTTIKVSSLCLGTMTWGEQNTEQEAFDQLDRATDYGINFIDTAELYPVPGRAETYAQTEVIIGATTMEQLESNLASSELTMPADVLETIDEVHNQQPNPAP